MLSESGLDVKHLIIPSVFNNRDDLFMSFSFLLSVSVHLFDSESRPLDFGLQFINSKSVSEVFVLEKPFAP